MNNTGMGGASSEMRAEGGSANDDAAGGTGATMAGGAQNAGGSAGSAGGDESLLDPSSPKQLIFLLLGQSNMEGQPQPEAVDRTENERISVLAYDTCPALGRDYGQWYPASPPMHSCGGGVGPGDYFAKTLIEALPEGYGIGLVPCAVNGAPIDLFRKGVPRMSHYLPPDDHWATGYEWIVSRARQAQESGTIAGLLFHQGESNDRQPDWVDKVHELVSDLRSDLDLGDAPFLVGELYHDGCCPGHNALIAELPELIDNAHVVSAEGLGGYDIYHFDLAAQRELGKRYGQKMIEVLGLGSNR